MSNEEIPTGSEVIADVQAYVEAAEAENTRDDAQIAALQQDVAAKDASIAAKDAELSAKAADIAAKDAQIAALTPPPGTVDLGRVASVAPVISNGVITAYEVTKPDGSKVTVPVPESGEIAMQFVIGVAAASQPPAGGYVAVAVADFANGSYEVDGAASTLTAMFPTSSDDWGSWDTARVVAGQGLTHVNGDGASDVNIKVGSWIDSMLPNAGGFTVVADLAGTGSNLSFVFGLYDSPDFGISWDVTDEGVYSGVGADFANDPTFPAALVRIAATYTASGGLAASRNGGAVVTDLPDQPEIINAAYVMISAPADTTTGDKAIIKKLTFYAPVSSADLPSLSSIS